MNLSDIQAECGRLLGDSSNTRWALAVLTTRANQAQIETQGYTDAVKSSYSYTATPGNAIINLNTDVMNVLRVTKTLIDGTVKPLPGITLQALDFLYPDWNQWSNGEPLYFAYDGTNTRISLIPVPDQAYGVNVTVSEIPTDMVNSTDIPFRAATDMVPYHMAIVHWVVAQCFMDDGTPEALAKARFHKSGSLLRPGEYEKFIGRIMAEFDVEDAVPNHILFKPQGGRVGSWMFPSKSNPLPW